MINRNKLRHGDISRIADMAGVAKATAYKTIYGTRHNEKVKRAANLLIESRESITRELQRA